MANRRNAQPNQIISGEFRQYFGIDIVREERSRILFESQAAQPIGDLDRHRRVRDHGLRRRRPRRSRTPVFITGVLPIVEDSLEDTM